MIIPGLLAYYGASEDWYDKFFADWGVDPSQEHAESAHDRYVTHTNDMRDKKGWPTILVSELQNRSKEIRDYATSQTTVFDRQRSAPIYWATLTQTEEESIRQLGADPQGLPNISNHFAFLESWTDAAHTYQEALDDYAPHNVAKETGEETVKDIGEMVGKGKEVLDPKKSIVPWLVGGIILIRLLGK